MTMFMVIRREEKRIKNQQFNINTNLMKNDLTQCIYGVTESGEALSI